MHMGKTIKTIACAVLIMAALTIHAFAAFTDVPADSWYAYPVEFLTEMGTIGGYGDGRFGPDDELEAAQFLKIVGLTFYPEEIEPEEEGELWGERFYDAALEHGIITEEFITRDESYTSLSRYKVAVILDLILSEVMGETVEPDPDIASRIGDWVGVPEEYRAAVGAVYTAGIIGGCDSIGSFLGDLPLTRAQTAAVMLRLLVPEERISPEPVPETPPEPVYTPMDDEWFENTMFLGDSLTHGLSLYGGLSTPTYYYYTGMSVFNVMSKTLECSKGSKKTLDEALASKNWERVYILLGINEIGSDTESYKTKYGELIDHIRAKLPNAEICIQTILPVSRSKEAQKTGFSKYLVDRKNAALAELAREKTCLLVDTHAALADSGGYLPESWTWDGVHLNVAQYKTWVSWLRTHVGG